MPNLGEVSCEQIFSEKLTEFKKTNEFDVP